MKLSFSTLGCPGWSFERILAEAEAMGFSGIEIRGVSGELRADRIPELFAENTESTKARLSVHGLEIPCFGTSVSFPGEAGPAVDEGLRAIDVCSRMGIPYIRVFGDIKGNRDEDLAAVISGISALCAAGEKEGVGVLLEVHGALNTLELIQTVCCGVDSPAFGILWDIANSDSVYGDGFEEFYIPLKDKIKHTHIKDCRRADGELCLPGMGDIPITAIVNRLMDDGYDGWLSFEWEKMWHPALPEPETAFPAYVGLMKSIQNGRGEG